MKTMNTWQTVKTKPISTTNMYQRQDTHTPQPADQTEVMTPEMKQENKRNEKIHITINIQTGQSLKPNKGSASRKGAQI